MENHLPAQVEGDCESKEERSFRRSYPFVVYLSFGLVAAVALCFAGLKQASFLDYDDPLMVSANEVVQKGLTAEGVSYAFTDTTMNLWHPLTWMTHMVDWQLFGDWAGGHHLVNVAWHAANAVLVFLLLMALTGRRGPSLLVAALFALHPMHVESVAWVSERKDVLSTFFYLATALAYVTWTKSRKLAWYIGAVALCLLGFLSKPSLITLPFALLLLDLWPLARIERTSFKASMTSLAQRALEKAPFFLLAAVFGVVAWKIEAGGGHEGLAEFMTLGERMAVTGLAYGSYLARTFWPADLAPFYAHPETLAPAAVACCWALLAAVSVAAVLLIKKAPYLFFGWFWFVGLMFPASGIMTISDNFAPDRYSYLAHFGLFVALIWGAADLASRFKIPVLLPRIAAGLAAAVLAVLCVQQTAVWKSDEVLWQHAVDVTERNYFAHNKLAVELLKAGRTEQAMEQLEASVAAKPDFAFAHANLGKVFAKRGDVPQAVHHFERAIAVKPNDLAMRRALVPLLQTVDRRDAMLPHLESITRLDPRDPKALYDLAGLLDSTGNTEQALVHYRQAAALTPASNFLVRGDLGSALVKSGDFAAAIAPLEAAAAQAANPHRDRAFYLLGLAQHKLGDQAAARRHLEAALQINPQLSRARNALNRISAAAPTPAAPPTYVIRTD